MSVATTNNTGNNSSSNAAEHSDAELTNQHEGGAISGDGHESGAEDEYEISLGERESGDESVKDRNRASAQKRLERKRQKQLEEAQRDADNGKLPDGIKSEYKPLDAPDWREFHSDEALEKYNWDENAANAAYQKALIEWQQKNHDGRNQHEREQQARTESYRQHSKHAHEQVTKFYDSAEKLNLADFSEKEEVFRSKGLDGWELQFMKYFPEKAPALVYYLGSNPHLIDRLSAMQKEDPVKVTLELKEMADRMTVKKKTRSGAPEPDMGVTGGNPGGDKTSMLKKQMDDAAKKGDTALYRKLKAQLKGVSK